MKQKYKMLFLHRRFSYTTVSNHRFFLEEMLTLPVALFIPNNEQLEIEDQCHFSYVLLLTVVLGSSSLNFKV